MNINCNIPVKKKALDCLLTVKINYEIAFFFKNM